MASARGDNERKRARYRVLTRMGFRALTARDFCSSPGMFRALLVAVGEDPSAHPELARDRRAGCTRRRRARYALPIYAAPVQIHRVISRELPAFPDLGELRLPLRSVLLAAGVIRSEDGNV